MSRHKAPPLSAQVVQDAATWFVEMNEGAVNRADREAFVEWLKASPEHIRAYLQVTAHWEESGALARTSVPSIADLAALARESETAQVIPIAGARLHDKARPAVTVTGVPRPTSQMRRYLLVASLALATIGGAGLYWFDRERGVYTTDIGEQRSIRLSDGSTVELNAHSKIRVAMGERERDVDLLDGQAMFRVAKDHARPFIVHSGDSDVLAVGTQFDVNKHPSGTTITVVEGRVAVFPSRQPSGEGAQANTPSQRALRLSRVSPSTHSAPVVQNGLPYAGSAASAGLAHGTEDASKSGEIFLTAGEQLTLSRASVQLPVNADVAGATAWTQRQIVFNSTPLSDVVDEFNRYNTRPLVITDPTIASTRISGEFASSNPDSLLKGLEGLNRFIVRELPDRIEISAR
jgi:transmembrane sensor